MILAVIDADIPLYQACSAVETPIDWGDDFWTLHADAREAKMIFDTTISDIKETVGAAATVLCFSGVNNWRKTVLGTYKYNRKTSRKPVCYREVKDYISRNYDFMVEADLEADDCVGLIATGPKSRWRSCSKVIMVSEDKDLKSIPGTLYNPRTKETQVITKEQANRWHMFQTLVGDPVDNYTGCPGIGPVSANRILDRDCSWESVVKAYEGCGFNEQDALTQAKVARILRHREYNFRTKEIKTWTPTRLSSTSAK